MRTPKKIYVIHEKKEIIDYDAYGNPIYDVVKTYTPIECDIEPFSNKLAETTYGVFVDTTHRVFTKSNKLLELDGSVKYDGGLYEITQIIKYDKHHETMLNKIGEADEL